MENRENCQWYARRMLWRCLLLQCFFSPALGKTITLTHPRCNEPTCYPTRWTL